MENNLNDKQSNSGLQLISLERVAQKLDMSTYSIRRMQDSGKMPPAMQVGRKLLKWREDAPQIGRI
jgi:predicted DNA-binding transcriptional regulator AlpA